jgi:hypothetical protein
MMNEYVPGAIVFATVTFTVAEPGGVIAAGVGAAHVTPVGKPLQLRVTAWLKAPVAVKATV